MKINEPEKYQAIVLSDVDNKIGVIIQKKKKFRNFLLYHFEVHLTHMRLCVFLSLFRVNHITIHLITLWNFIVPENLFCH